MKECFEISSVVINIVQESSKWRHYFILEFSSDCILHNKKKLIVTILIAWDYLFLPLSTQITLLVSQQLICYNDIWRE